MFELAANHLAPGGRLVFNTFVARTVWWSTGPPGALRTGVLEPLHLGRGEPRVLDLPLDLVADDSVHDYEEANLPAGRGRPPAGTQAGSRDRTSTTCPGTVPERDALARLSEARIG